jgi:hypothetical protein
MLDGRFREASPLSARVHRDALICLASFTPIVEHCVNVFAKPG